MAFDYILALLLACFILSANSRFIEEGAVGSDSFPIPTENIKETVPFKVVETKDAYEIRIYDAGDFAVTEAFQSAFTISYTKGLSYLNAYFLGRNKDNVRMDRTVPFWTKLWNDEEYRTTNRTYEHAFYIPQKYQGKTPEPSSDKVKVVSVPGGRAYTREFSGFATEGKALGEALRLHNALLADDIHGFEDHFFWLGVYDPPVKIMNRKNVILFYGKHVGEQQRTAPPLLYLVKQLHFTPYYTLPVDIIIALAKLCSKDT